MTQTAQAMLSPTELPAARWRQRLRALLQNLATLLLLLLALPFNLLFAALALLLWWLRLPFQSMPTSLGAPKTILISGGKMTKALQLARSFHRAGHRVILLETHKYWLVGHRFSFAVDRFHTINKPGTDAYITDLLQIVQQENVDVYVPVCSPVASFYDAQAKATLAPFCEVLHVDSATIERLDDKYQFAETAHCLGLPAPKSFRITDPQQVLAFDFSQENRPYILKSIPYDSVRRLNLTQLPCATQEETAAFVRSLPISPNHPWVMQEFIAGTEFCTHSMVRDGELRVYGCCESSAFQVNYQHVEQLRIRDWVTHFVSALGLTGQVSFDFIQAEDDGQIYAIECNPRTHSAVTMFYDHPQLADAYLDNQPQAQAIEPLPSSRPTYWLYHELWRLLTHLHQPKQVLQRLKILAQGKDAIFDWDDPLPFLMVHHWQIPLLLLRDLRQLRGWVRIDFNIGKLVQLGGD
jgi:hypothetical protein